MHEHRYGSSAPAEPAEIVSLRTTVTGDDARSRTLEAIAGGSDAPPEAANRGSRRPYFAARGGFVDTPTFERRRCSAGNRIAGPALIEEHASTTVAHPGDSVEVDAFGNLVIAVSGRHAQ